MQLFDFDKIVVCSNLRKAFTQQEGSMIDLILIIHISPFSL
jgi:hypothetical protein